MVRNVHDEVTDRDESVSTLAELIKDIRVCMLTTMEEDGTLRSRPMATQNEKFDGVLWFFTDADAPKTEEIRHERRVNVSFANPDDQVYVSVSGTATVVRDTAKTRELWTPFHKAWFPNGPDDPNLALLRVQVEQAEYWKGPPGTVVRLVGFAKALVTGQRYEPGENRKLDLSSAAEAATSAADTPDFSRHDV